MRAVLWLAVLSLLAAVALQQWGLPALRIGAAFRAKRMCSSVFVSHTAPQTEALPAFNMLPIRMEVEGSSVVALFMHGPRWELACATYREGFGCTLHPQRAVCEWKRSIVADAPVDVAISARVQRLVDARMNASLPNEFATPIDANGVVVLHGGRVVAESYRSGFTADSLQHGWSMTKSVLGLLVAAAVREGRMALDAPVHFPPAGAVREPGLLVQHLLDMASGLDWDEQYGPFGDATRMLFASADVASFAAARGFKYAPGSHWHYSSYDSNLLGYQLCRTFDDNCACLKWIEQQLAPVRFVIETDPQGLPVFSSFGWASARGWAMLGARAARDELVRARISRVTNASLTTGKREPYGGHMWQSGGHKFKALPPTTFFFQGFEYQWVAVLPEADVVIVQLARTRPDRVVATSEQCVQRFLLDVLSALTK